MSTLTAYRYRGRNPNGRIVKGRIEASSQASAIAKVTALGVAPIEVAPAKSAGLQMEIEIPGLTKGVSKKDLAVMSRQMATMIGAGLSLVTALTVLAEQTEQRKLREALAVVRADIEQGRSFSDALAKHDRIFPPLMVSLLRAGESGGFLERSLDAVAVNFEKEVKLAGSIKSALTMPMIVLVIALIAVAAMLIFIVPTFATMFEQIGSELPLPTQILVGISGAMPFILPAVVLLVIGIVVWWRYNGRKPAVRAVIDPIRLKLPVFGPLNTRIAIARFARNFAAMLGSGVPILRALQIVGETSGNYTIEQAMDKVAASVRVGGSVAAPLIQSGVFPTMVTQMIAVGENAGAMETMLDKVADFYDAEVESQTEQLTTAIEPIMISGLGIIVGAMVVALYLPMFSLMGEIGG